MSAKQLMQTAAKPIKASIATYTLRLPRNLLEQLHYIADYEGRSANMEIIQLIKNHIAAFEEKYGEIKMK